MSTLTLILHYHTQTISSKFSTFADGADGYATAAQDTPGFGDADALSIMSAMDQVIKCALTFAADYADPP
jgi:hypothetical protein